MKIYFFDRHTGRQTDRHTDRQTHRQTDRHRQTRQDISLSHPCNEDIILQASKVDGAAAAKRESQKTEKCSRESDAMGNASNCIPLVFSITAAGDGKPTNSTSFVPIICR